MNRSLPTSASWLKVLGLLRWFYPALMVFTMLAFALPLVWVLSTSLKTPAQIYTVPIHWWPDSPTLQNFIQGQKLMDFPLLFKNSLFLALAQSLGAVFSNSLVAFAFATLRARGKGFLFALLIGMVMIPPTITLIPTFMWMSQLGLVPGVWPLILPAWCANGFFVLMLYPFFRSLPKELFENATLDGCNPWQTYRYIAFPLARPVLGVVGLLSFISSWNDFLGPLVYLKSSQATLSVGLVSFQSRDLYGTQVHYIVAMALLTLLPIILIAWGLQKLVLRTFQPQEPL